MFSSLESCLQAGIPIFERGDNRGLNINNNDSDRPYCVNQRALGFKNPGLRRCPRIYFRHKAIR